MSRLVILHCLHRAIVLRRIILGNNDADNDTDNDTDDA